MMKSEVCVFSETVSARCKIRKAQDSKKDKDQHHPNLLADFQ